MGSSASQHVHYPTTESSSTPPTPLLNPPQSILLVSPRQFTTFLAPLTEQFPNIIHITTDRSNTATPPSIAELQALLPNPLPPGPITLLVCSTSNTLPSLLITALLTASPPLPLSSLYLLPIPPLSTPTHLAHSYNIHTLSDAIFLLANPTVTRADVCALTVPADPSLPPRYSLCNITVHSPTTSVAISDYDYDVHSFHTLMNSTSQDEYCANETRRHVVSVHVAGRYMCVGNAKTCGKKVGPPIGNNCKVDDGVLDVVVVEKGGKSLLKNAAKTTRKWYSNQPSVLYLKADNVTIKCPKKGVYVDQCCVDGEYGEKTLTMKVIKQGLQVIAAKGDVEFHNT